jgi:hypothetical protein
MDLMAKKSIARLPSGELKPSVPCHNTLRFIKELFRYEKRYFADKIQYHFSQVSPASLLGVSATTTEL